MYRTTRPGDRLGHSAIRPRLRKVTFQFYLAIPPSLFAEVVKGLSAIIS
jgi:glucose-6-phosphate 1-dehydrogenase